MGVGRWVPATGNLHYTKWSEKSKAFLQIDRSAVAPSPLTDDLLLQLGDPVHDGPGHREIIFLGITERFDPLRRE